MPVSPDTELEEASPQEAPSASNAHVRNVAIGLAVVALVLALLALLRAGNDPASTAWNGRILETPEPKPPIELVDTAGNPFDLQGDTRGKLTLLMFGYANCPDVCPISLGTLQAALEQLDPTVANNVEMVFVTADPERDTPEALREYLDGYNREFLGIWGSTSEIDEAQTLANVPQAIRETPDEDGNYTVGHATQIIAYQSDDIARIVYPFGTRQEDWIRDLPRLVEGELPAP